MDDQPIRLPLIVRVRRARNRLLRWLSDLGAAIVSPFERAFAAVVGRIFRAAEGFQGVESFLVGLLLVLLWPLRAVWRALTAVFRLIPNSVRNALAAPFHLLAAIWHRGVIAFLRIVESLNLDAFVLWLVRWTWPIWYPIVALGGFGRAWLSTRNYRQLLWGLPVIIVLLPLAVIGGWTAIQGSKSFATQYNIAVNEARENKDYERVRLFQRKLAQLGVSTDLTDFQTALALAKDGDLEQAYARMQQLAPLDEAGFLQAHVWIVEQLVSNALKLPPDESQRLLKIHLAKVRELGARGPQIDLLDSVVLVRDRQFAEAAEKLAPLVSQLPIAAIMRMECNMSLNRADDARNDARMVRSHMEARARQGASLSAEECRVWLAAEGLLANFEKAHELAQQWHQLEPQNRVARRVLVELSGQLFKISLALPDPDADRLTELFLLAAELADNPKALQSQFASLYRLREDFPLAQQVVDRVVNSPRTPATILEAAGTVAATVGEPQRAKVYLQQALKKDPRNSIALNNYAWLILQEPNGDLNAALAAVNQAIEIKPEEFRYRETRGQVLVRLKRWREAVDDLEYAANGMPSSKEVHLALAKAYDALGNQQLAQVHRAHAGAE